VEAQYIINRDKLKNLRETLDPVFLTHEQALEAVNTLMRQQPVRLPDGAVAVPVPPPVEMLTPAQQRAGQRQARRQALHQQVWALHRQGWTAPAIVQQVGLSLRTVQRDLRTATFAGRKRRSDLGDSMLNPSKAYLLARWNAGCHTAMRLFRALRQRGYGGSYGVVAAYARRLRQAQGLPPGHRRPRQTLPAVAEPSCLPLTPRRATWLVLRRETKRTETEAQQLTALRGQQAEVAEAIDLAQDFMRLVRQRQPERLDPWLQRATTSAVDAIRRFATGLYEDYEAVKAGVTLPWNSGPVEGHINRLKMLKRQMFGRAHLDLLSRRFLLAPRDRRARVPDPQERSDAHAQAVAA
jgi:transposase